MGDTYVCPSLCPVPESFAHWRPYPEKACSFGAASLPALQSVVSGRSFCLRVSLCEAGPARTLAPSAPPIVRSLSPASSDCSTVPHNSNFSSKVFPGQLLKISRVHSAWGQVEIAPILPRPRGVRVCRATTLFTAGNAGISLGSRASCPPCGVE